MFLHIGDKILEVNGEPVKDQPLENIENLLKFSDRVVQLTIEHDPDATAKRRHNLKLSPVIAPSPKVNFNFSLIYNVYIIIGILL